VGQNQKKKPQKKGGFSPKGRKGSRGLKIKCSTWTWFAMEGLGPLTSLACSLPRFFFGFFFLVAAVLIAFKGVEPPGSGRREWLVRWIVFPHLRPSRINLTLPGRTSRALRHWNLVEYSELADSVHADRTWSNKRRLTWTVYDTPLMTLTTDLGLSIRVSTFEHVDWWLGPLPRSHGMVDGGDW